jgi:hypothetical protein
VVEGHVVEVTQAMLWALAVAAALVSAVRQPARIDRRLALWLATLAGSPYSGSWSCIGL